MTRVKCPYCKKEFSLDDKELARHMGSRGGVARKKKLSIEELSRIGRLGAMKRWGKV